MAEVDFFGDGSCIALYRLDGDLKDDVSGGNATATVNGYGEGVLGSALDGNNLKNTTINVPPQFTVSLFLKDRSASTAIRRWISTSSWPLGGVGVCCLREFNNETLTLMYGDNSKTIPWGASDKGRWRHIVLSVDASDIKVYVDGAQVMSNPFTRVSSTTGIWIGGGDGSPPEDFIGTLDHIRIFDRGVSLLEVSALMALELPRKLSNTTKVPTAVLMSTLPASLSRGFR